MPNEKVSQHKKPRKAHTSVRVGVMVHTEGSRHIRHDLNMSLSSKYSSGRKLNCAYLSQHNI